MLSTVFLNRWICFILIHEIIHFLVKFYFIFFIVIELKFLDMKLINCSLWLRLSIFIFRFCFRDLGKTHSQEIGALFKCNTYWSLKLLPPVCLSQSSSPSKIWSLRDGEPGGLLSIGLHRVRYDWSDLAAAADHIWKERITTGMWRNK